MSCIRPSVRNQRSRRLCSNFNGLLSKIGASILHVLPEHLGCNCDIACERQANVRSLFQAPSKASHMQAEQGARTITNTYTYTVYTTTYTVTSSGDTCPPVTPPATTPTATPTAGRTKKPACLSSYKGTDAISSACSCVVPTDTVTVLSRSTVARRTVSYISTDLTTTKTLLPAPTCSTVAGNSTYNLSEFYSGCGFSRNTCPPSENYAGRPICEAIQGCAEIAATRNAYPG